MASRAEWAERVGRWEASGLSAAAFGARERLAVKSLVWWRWKLRASPSVPPASPLDFLPVRVVRTTTARPSTAEPLEIVLPNGRVVRVPVGFDEGELERVLAVASGSAAC
jgi:transposase